MMSLRKDKVDLLSSLPVDLKHSHWCNKVPYSKISPPLKMLYWKNTRGSTCSRRYMTETYSWSLQIPSFCRAFSWVWSQPSRATVKHNVTLYGLSLCGRSVSKTVLKSFSKKCLKMVTASSAAFSDTWNCRCSGITDCHDGCIIPEQRSFLDNTNLAKQLAMVLHFC